MRLIMIKHMNKRRENNEHNNDGSHNDAADNYDSCGWSK